MQFNSNQSESDSLDSLQSDANQHTTSNFLKGLLAILICTLVFVVGVGVGMGMNTLRSAGTRAFGAENEVRSQLEPDHALFWEAMQVLYRDFYGELPDGKEATYASIRGVVNTLKDEHTSFMEPREADYFRENLNGEFEGIGARVDWEEEARAVRITEPFENQPAWNAGLRRDDLIIAINKESVASLDLSQAIEKIRGPKGSKVLLTILRKAVADPFDVEVTRERIELPTVRTDSLGPNQEIAYIKLFTFNENSGQLVRQALEDALKGKPKAILFDLRGNGGGLLREAVKIANLFLPKNEVILYERFKDGKSETYKTTTTPLDSETPMVVLVNEASASASEIVAGALQDLKRAKLLGVTTFGKGSVQLPQTLSDGSILRVTIAKWFTPNDRTIDGTGLAPDIEVKISEEERKAEKDPQLEAALKYLIE